MITDASTGDQKVTTFRSMDDVFKALADPTRRGLLDELFHKDGQSPDPTGEFDGEGDRDPHPHQPPGAQDLFGEGEILEIDQLHIGWPMILTGF